jgi:hypothetical protein
MKQKYFIVLIKNSCGKTKERINLKERLKCKRINIKKLKKI